MGFKSKNVFVTSVLGLALTAWLVGCDKSPQSHETRYRKEVTFEHVYKTAIERNCAGCHTDYKAKDFSRSEMERAYLNFTRKIHTQVAAMGNSIDLTRTETYELVNTGQMPMGTKMDSSKKNLLLYWLKLGANFEGPEVTPSEYQQILAANPTQMDVKVFNGKNPTDVAGDDDGGGDGDEPGDGDGNSDDDTPPPLAANEVDLSYDLMYKTVFKTHCNGCHRAFFTDPAGPKESYDRFIKAVKEAPGAIDGQTMGEDLKVSEMYDQVFANKMPKRGANRGFKEADAPLKDIYLLYFEKGLPYEGLRITVDDPVLLNILKPPPSAEVEVGFDLAFQNVLGPKCSGCHQDWLLSYTNEDEKKVSFETLKAKLISSGAIEENGAMNWKASDVFKQVQDNAMPFVGGFSPEQIGFRKLFNLFFELGVPMEPKKVKISDMDILNVLGITPVSDSGTPLAPNPTPVPQPPAPTPGPAPVPAPVLRVPQFDNTPIPMGLGLPTESWPGRTTPNAPF